MGTLAAMSFVVVIALLVIFQLLLALGVPWGRFAWGGQHDGKLPVGYRIASAVSILIYGFLGTVILDRAGVISLYDSGFVVVMAWITFGYLTLGVLMNAVSRSQSERNLMTPVALVLAILAFIVALGV